MDTTSNQMLVNDEPYMKSPTDFCLGNNFEEAAEVIKRLAESCKIKAKGQRNDKLERQTRFDRE